MQASSLQKAVDEAPPFSVVLPSPKYTVIIEQKFTMSQSDSVRKLEPKAQAIRGKRVFSRAWLKHASAYANSCRYDEGLVTVKGCCGYYVALPD